MKNLKLNQKRYKGFTLVELLVVVVIIAVLMGMLIPAVMRAKVRARIATARADMSNIKGAILSYQTDYSRFPIPRGLSPNLQGGDITFGGAVTSSRPNYGVMRILCSFDDSNPPTDPRWLGPPLTINGNFSRNPKKNRYLEASSDKDPGDPGLDPIYNFNDPWGQQYTITMDMDGDGDCSDEQYRKPLMNAGVVIGLRKLTPPGGTSPADDEHVLMGSVMIYSRGPDQKASNAFPALEGVNADNILDWR